MKTFEKNSILYDYCDGENIWFEPEAIYHKFGFADGDLLSDLYWDWLSDNGIPHSDRRDVHKILYNVVRKWVIPPEINLEFEITPHNPVRNRDEPVDYLPEEVLVSLSLIYEEFRSAHE